MWRLLSFLIAWWHSVLFISSECNFDLCARAAGCLRYLQALQSCSSEPPSPQSLKRSHCSWVGIHLWLLQVNSVFPQGRGLLATTSAAVHTQRQFKGQRESCWLKEPAVICNLFKPKSRREELRMHARTNMLLLGFKRWCNGRRNCHRPKQSGSGLFHISLLILLC